MSNQASSDSQHLQEGIYYSKGAKPGKFFCLLFLRADPSSDSVTVGGYLSRLWNMYSDLKKGKITDLPGYTIPDGNLTVLIGYGKNFFGIDGIKRTIPSELRNFGTFRSPAPLGGGPLLLGSGLDYSSDIIKNPATEDIAIQFIADTQLAINRCILETWKFFHDNVNTGINTSPLTMGHFFSGFQRDDFRSMLDFHDGLSNMESGNQRFQALAIKPTNLEEDQWTQNGTYLVFLRIVVDLSIWRKISRSKQEIIIGRDKLSGCPIVDIDPNGNPIIVDGCPAQGTKEVTEPQNERYHDIDSGAIIHNDLKRSHIMRANHNRDEDPGSRNSLRVYRQGYEFVEQISEEPGFRWGLNFVSFQDTPERLIRMLTTPNWLGNTNFGGSSKAPHPPGTDPPLPGMDRLLSVRAAGIYLIPPMSSTEVLPGSSLFL